MESLYSSLHGMAILISTFPCTNRHGGKDSAVVFMCVCKACRDVWLHLAVVAML